MSWISGSAASMRHAAPGLAVAVAAAAAARFVGERYGLPDMLAVLLIGLALNRLSADERCALGVAYASSVVLRVGVALLGLRIGPDLVFALGWDAVALAIGALAATIVFGFLASSFFGHDRAFGVLSAGSVAVCGASAALAISSSFPAAWRREDHLAFTIVFVALLSTAAMVLYPILALGLGFDERMTGIFLGGAIHDVAQVAGAGFSVSDRVGETAIVVKLIRVAMLAPVVLGLSLFVRLSEVRGGSSRSPLLPGFVVVFIGLAALNAMFDLPAAFVDRAAEVSHWALLTAVAAVGMKTSFSSMAGVGVGAMALIVAETLFLAVVVAAGLMVLGA